MERGGKLIEHVDPKPAIKKHQETAEWEYRDESKFWNQVAKTMDERFFNGLLYPDGKKVPPPVIAFENLRNKNTLAAYDLFPDEYGIVGKITFNTAHYVNAVDESERAIKVWERGRYSQGETLLHEYIHLWQQIGRGKDPYRWEKHRKETHNKEFVAKAEEFGIHPMPVQGVHTSIATPGSPIDILLKELGIFPPEGADKKPEDDRMDWAIWLIFKGKERPAGKSTLNKWLCPDCGLAVRIGIKSDPGLVHDPCSEKRGEKVFLVRADGKAHTIYKSK
jgi:hypothetical protein